MEEMLQPPDHHADRSVSALDVAQLQAQNRLLLTLFRVASQLAAELGTRDLPGHAVRIIVDTLPEIDIVGLWLYDRAERRLRLAAIHSAPDVPQLAPELAAQLLLRLNEGAVGTALADHRPLLLPDRQAFADDVHALSAGNAGLLQAFAAQLPPSLRVVCLPLYLGTIPIGVLQLFDIGAGPIGNSSDLPLLQAFADQLAVVLRNAQIYAEMSEQHRRLQSFDAVVTAITAAADLPQMLEQVLSVTLYVVGAQSGMILLLNDGQAQIEVSYQLPTPDFAPGTIIDIDQTALGDAVRSGQPALQALPPEQPWAGLWSQGLEAIGLLPLIASSAVVGVLVLGLAAGQERLLDWPTLAALGNQIGIAIANHKLYMASQRERRQLAGVIASIAEGVIICDRAGQIVLSNQGATTMLEHPLHVGTSIDELARDLGMRTLDGWPLPDDALPLARSLRGEAYQDYEISVTNGSGSAMILNSSGAPLLADDGTIDGAVVVFRDMTAYKQHDAVREEFIAVAAHEMRAPLAAIKGYTDLLVQREMQRPDATERDRKGILMLSRQIEHLIRLVDNSLDVSRLDAGRFELYLQPADLVALIEASIDRISIGDANHHFVYNGPSSLPIVCDQLRIQQVFTNLLSNAARYSTAGTQITVDVWTEPCTIVENVVSGRGGSDQCVIVAVRDQGVGMTPEVQAKVFERYYRANTMTAASGLGLGVYISREIVMRHGGQIWLESAPGAGTSFYVMLPLRSEVEDRR